MNVYAKFHHNILNGLRVINIFHFFRIWSSTKPRPMKNIISQSLGLDRVNINVCANVYQNIPLSSRDRAIFTFSEFEPRQRLGQSQMTFDNLLGYILSISMRKQNFIKKKLSTFFTNRPASTSSQTRRRQNFHKLSGDKIKCLIIGHYVKLNIKFQLTFLGSCNRSFGREVSLNRFFFFFFFIFIFFFFYLFIFFFFLLL